jgi:hypothetical protein
VIDLRSFGGNRFWPPSLPGSPSWDLSRTELEVGLETKPPSRPILRYVSKYKRLTTHVAYSYAIDSFLESCSKPSLKQIDRRDGSLDSFTMCT